MVSYSTNPVYRNVNDLSFELIGIELVIRIQLDPGIEIEATGTSWEEEARKSSEQLAPELEAESVRLRRCFDDHVCTAEPVAEQYNYFSVNGSVLTDELRIKEARPGDHRNSL
jgi:hypothetical protein